MAILQLTLSVLLISLAVADDSCPSKDKIAPCTCDGEGVNCMGNRTVEEIKKAFRSHFNYGSVRSVWIQGTPITNIPGDLFGIIKSQQFHIEVNNIITVDLKAFSESKQTLKVLSLFGNKLTFLDFPGLNQFETLDLFNIGRNYITSIPDSAFNSSSLSTIILAQNAISHIGANAFANLPNLNKLELTSNQLTVLGPLSFASNSHSASLMIHLAANKISTVSSTAFKGIAPQGLILSQNGLTSLPSDAFADLVTRIAQRGGFIEVSANPFSCTGCDYSWIVLNKNLLYSKFIGFTCTDGRSMRDLTDYNIRCYN